MARAAKGLTPMLRHYLETKAQHPDAILFYRMGDFFELFYDDAKTAAPILEVTLTARHKGGENEAPMCGVPHHALEGYVGKLLRAGHRVAICDQVEDPATAKGLVKREVTRVMTPGTLSEPGLLEGREENLLVCVRWAGAEGAGAFLDVSTGTFFVRRWSGASEATDDLGVLAPSEVLGVDGELPELVRSWVEKEVVCWSLADPADAPDRSVSEALLGRQLEVSTLAGFGLRDGEPAVLAAGWAIAYARDTQRNELGHIRRLVVRQTTDTLVLDPTTLSNLDVLAAGRDGSRRASLIGVCDRTVTSAGGRLVRDWLRRPLRDAEAIRARHEAVGELLHAAERRERLREGLAGIPDFERLATRAVLGTMTPREAASVRAGLRLVPDVATELASFEAPLLSELADVDPLAELAADLERTLVEEPPATFKDGGVIAEGLDADLDEAKSLARDSKQHILALQAREREATGISSLKIRYNRVFGYFLEVTKSNLASVPEHYIRKQTLVNSERFVTPEIKELEDQILSAEARQLALEDEFYRALLDRIAARAEGLGRIAASLGAVDVMAGFADLAARRGYARPEIGPPGDPIVIRDGRHPVVEALSMDPFVPNDTELDSETNQIVVLTGPNMGGKSTYLRQIALIVIMAQAGSFVPAAEASLGLADRVFTRVGASDDLARGESTFMVEMIETARILNQATAESLVILDEVGRGTATFDGLSLAWAIVEHLHEHARPKTVFATHYHELTELASILERVVNRTITVKEWDEQIVFLRRVVPGSADKSYGIQVAKLAGLPPEVTKRAAEVLQNLERHEYTVEGRPRLADGPSAPPIEVPEQLQLFVAPEQIVAKIVREVDVERLTPLAALNLLESLKERLG